MNARIFRFDDWTLNLQSGELLRGTARSRLQEHPLQVLASLLENPGEVVTREQLIARLWPNTVVDFDTGLNTAVRKLRAALGDTADTPRYIETLPRRGYRFIAPVEPEQGAGGAPAPASAAGHASAATPAPTDAPATVQAVSRTSSLRIGRRLLTVAIPAALILAGGLAWLLRGEIFRTTAHTDLPPAASLPGFTPPPRSVAVLPFVNMSGDSTQDYFSDGLSEELLNALSRIDDLQVAAQTSSFYFKGKSVELATVARRLNVATILEGSVRRSGRTVRITAQLINAVTGFHIWSQTYDRNIDDALTVQTEIANSVASALKITLLDHATAKFGLGGTRNPQALDAYLRGLKLAFATIRSGEEAREAIAAFTEAIRLDPNFALAYAGRARAWVDYGSFFLVQATREAFINAKTDATRAIDIEPQLGEGYSALGQALASGFLDFPGAAAAFERAMVLSPGDARVLRSYSRFIGNMGNPEVAITTARRGIELDPLSVYAYQILGEALENARRFPEAIEAFEKAIKLNPSHATEAYQRRGRLYYLIGNYALAKASCEVEPDVYHMQDCMPLIYERLGQKKLADAALATAIAQQGDYAAYQYAQIYAQWGQPQKALDWLDVAFKVSDPGLTSLKVDPFLDPLHNEPRFQALERTLKFPP